MLALKVLHHMEALSLTQVGMAEQQLALLKTRSLQKSSRASHSLVVVVLFCEITHIF